MLKGKLIKYAGSESGNDKEKTVNAKNVCCVKINEHFDVYMFCNKPRTSDTLSGTR
jgi:hypothetical protein